MIEPILVFALIIWVVMSSILLMFATYDREDLAVAIWWPIVCIKFALISLWKILTTWERDW